MRFYVVWESAQKSGAQGALELLKYTSLSFSCVCVVYPGLLNNEIIRYFSHTSKNLCPENLNKLCGVLFVKCCKNLFGIRAGQSADCAYHGLWLWGPIDFSSQHKVRNGFAPTLGVSAWPSSWDVAAWVFQELSVLIQPHGGSCLSRPSVQFIPHTDLTHLGHAGCCPVIGSLALFSSESEQNCAWPSRFPWSPRLLEILVVREGMSAWMLMSEIIWEKVCQGLLC